MIRRRNITYSKSLPSNLASFNAGKWKGRRSLKTFVMVSVYSFDFPESALEDDGLTLLSTDVGNPMKRENIQEISSYVNKFLGNTVGKSY